MMSHMLEKTKQLIVFGAILGLVFGTGSLGFAENAYADKKDDWREKFKEIKEKIKEHKEKKQNHKKSKTLEDRCAKHDGKFSFRALVCQAILSIQVQLDALQTQVDGIEDTTLSEAEVEDFVTNDAIDLSAGSTVGGQPISTEPDTNAETICDTGELLDGDGKCIDIPTGGGGGPSGVQLNTVEIRSDPWVFPTGDNFSDQITLSCENSNQRITGLFVDVNESQDGHSPINMQQVSFSKDRLTEIHEVTLILVNYGPFENPNTPEPEPVLAQAVALCTSAVLVP